MKYPKKAWRTLTGDWLEREMTPSEKLHYAERRIAELEACLRQFMQAHYSSTHIAGARKRTRTVLSDLKVLEDTDI